MAPLPLYLTLACLVAGNAFNLTILHTNDVHARFDEAQKYGGICTKSDRDNSNCVGGISRRFVTANGLFQAIIEWVGVGSLTLLQHLVLLRTQLWHHHNDHEEMKCCPLCFFSSTVALLLTLTSSPYAKFPIPIHISIPALTLLPPTSWHLFFLPTYHLFFYFCFLWFPLQWCDDWPKDLLYLTKNAHQISLRSYCI